MVMVGEDLDSTYARLEQWLEAHPQASEANGPPAAPGRTRTRAGFIGLGILAALPFIWLGVLHFTLGGLVEGLWQAKPATVEAPREVEALTAEVHQLEQQLTRLQEEVSRSRSAAPRDRSPRTGRPKPPKELRGTDGGPANVRETPEPEPSADDPEPEGGSTTDQP